MKRLTMLVGVFIASMGYIAPASAQSENGEDGISAVPAITSPSVVRKSLIHTARVMVTIIPVSGVSVASPNYAANKLNILTGLGYQTVPNDRTQNPAAWHNIAYLEWGDMVLSSSNAFKVWRGRANPSGTFSNERGNRIKWTVTALSTNGIPFSANQVEFEIKSSFEGLNLIGRISRNSATGADIPYQFILQGHNYGSDSVPNTGDDIWYNSDTAPISPSALVHELRYMGVSSSFSAANLADIGADRNALTAEGFFVGCRYTLKAADNTIIGSAEVVLDTRPRASIRKVGDGYEIGITGQPEFGYNVVYAFRPSGPWENFLSGTGSSVPGVYTPGSVFTNVFSTSDVAFFRLRQTAAP
ncbi:MAG: hypothetical protein NUV53_01550 [Patescibacteria group bacterium]|nr:hypothetical protein [Patescibacteria group bacterium]